MAKFKCHIEFKISFQLILFLVIHEFWKKKPTKGKINYNSKHFNSLVCKLIVHFLAHEFHWLIAWYWMECDGIILIFLDAKTFPVWFNIQRWEKANSICNPVIVINSTSIISVRKSTNNYENVLITNHRLNLRSNHQKFISILESDQIEVWTEAFAISSRKWRS